MEKMLTNELNLYLCTSLDEINPKLRISTSMSALIRAVDKEFCLSDTIEPIEKFHTQRKEYNETKWIKAAFTSPRLNEAAQRIATVIANEPPAEMPVLRGLVQETANKSTSAMERRIQSLEDQLKAVQGKKTPKKSKGDGTKKNPPGILKNKDTPIADKKKKKKSIPKSVVSPTLGANSNDTVKGNGKKKKGERKVSFDGKKAAKPKKSRK
jgi:hypothetical protein